ncbi:hypothetical protein ACFVT9_07655 [Kitasatospora cineracea]|uniref:hypothetical protein n=1 Tax=Kitasatospora cineracea TaxID=88074 RepID=UPI0036C4A37E
MTTLIALLGSLTATAAALLLVLARRERRRTPHATGEMIERMHTTDAQGRKAFYRAPQPVHTVFPNPLGRAQDQDAAP